MTLQQFVKRYFNNILIEKNFLFDEDFSMSGAIAYSKYAEERPKPGWRKTFKGDCYPDREAITFSFSRFGRGITVDLNSTIKSVETDVPGIANINHLTGASIPKWWSISTKEDAEKAFHEIKSLLDKYAWDWFMLK